MDTTKLKDKLDGKVQGLQEQAAPTAAVVPAGSGYTALSGNALEVIRDNLKNQPLSLDLFDIVKSPSGGSTVFSVPGLTGEEAEKELTGIVLDYTTPRAYWDTPDPIEGTPPVCMSQNSIVSHDGKACYSCPFNDFGSKDGESNAKACDENHLGEGHQQGRKALCSVQLRGRKPAQPSGGRTRQGLCPAVYGQRERRRVDARFGGGKLR